MKVEEMLPELSEKEEIIKAYLERDETLPSEILDEVLQQFWHDEPFRSRGFVLDGFPANDFHAQYLIERGLYPDAIIMLRMSDDVCVKRLLPDRLKSWREKVAARKNKRAARLARKKEKLVSFHF